MVKGVVRAGDTIESPVSGERVAFLATAAESGGRLTRAEVQVRPQGFATGNAEHVHARQEERFEMREGHITFRIDGAERRAGPGEVVIVPAGHRHKWWNADVQPATFILEVEPALNFETILETMFGLARDGKTNRNGLPNLLQLAVIAESAEGYRNRIDRALIGILAFAGRLAGYRDRYNRYSGKG
jgi:mannose-6-phosphate isomerase-like protein (cupin superfamily)